MFPAPDLHRAYQTYLARQDGANAHLLIEALDYLIDRRLMDGRDLLPGASATGLLADLANLGATHKRGGLTESLTVYGVTATCTCGGAGLLRNWQLAARRTLRAGQAAGAA